MRDESRATMRERGFSMIELMVAMVITLLIMGSVYGLIAAARTRSGASRSWRSGSRTSAWPWT